MFVGFYRNIFSMNAMTHFEKCRMQVTYYGDTYPPEESAVKELLAVLSGKDPETKPSLAFNVITAKLETSKSLKYWNYVVKNLVVLDRAIDENLFVKDIAKLNLPSIEKYQPKEEKYVQRQIGELIHSYYKYVKTKAAIFENPKSGLHISREKRKEYFQSSDPERVLEENENLSKICKLGIEVFQTGSYGHLKYHLTQYVFLLVLNTLLNILSVQYTAFIGIIGKFFETDLEVAKECFEAFKSFLLSTNDLITATADYQFIPGFQISLYEIRNPKSDANLLKAMQEYIRLLQRKEQPHRVNFSISNFNIRPEDFRQKRGSEIDVPLCLERIRASIQHSPLHKTKTANLDNSFTQEDAHEEQKTPSRPSIMFSRSFHHGFQAPVIIGEEEIKKIMEDDIYDIGRISIEEKDEGEEGSRVLDYLDPASSDRKPLAFDQLFNLKEKDSTYESHHNFYSGEYIKDIQTQYLDVYKRKGPNIHELKPLGTVYNNTESFGRLKDEEFRAKDFDDTMFDRFESNFSKP